MQIIQIPVLKDNYIYLLHGGGQTAVVDPAVAEPVLAELSRQGWKLDYILNTHHHGDHIGGNKELKAKTGCKIVAYEGDAHRIPDIDIQVKDGNTLEICGRKARVMFVPGHTLGHIAYYFASEGALFCGDTLFAMGCGRLFEGTPQQMFDSLKKIAKLPQNTEIYCAHEYTLNNGEFALTVEPDNQSLKKRMDEVITLRDEDRPTIPTTLGVELKTNPFLLAKDADEFARRREMKDVF